MKTQLIFFQQSTNCNWEIRSENRPVHRDNISGNSKAAHLPSGYVKIAIENGPVEIVDFPIEHGWIFPSFFVNVYQAG